MAAPTRYEDWLLFAGAAHLDDIARSASPLIAKASNTVTWSQSVGGVAANAACAAAQTTGASMQICFQGAVGDDVLAVRLETTLQQQGLHCSLQHIEGQATGRYSAIMDHDGELYLGLSDVALAEQFNAASVSAALLGGYCKGIMLDTNLSESCIESVIDSANQRGVPVAAIGVSPLKCQRLTSSAKKLDILFCNRLEAIAMINARQAADIAGDTDPVNLADSLAQLGFRQFVLTDASAPIIVQSHEARVSIPVTATARTQTVNGAGDALAGSSFAAWCSGQTLSKAVSDVGLRAAQQIVSGERQAPVFVTQS